MVAFSWPGGCPDPKPEKPLYIKGHSHIHLHDLSELQTEISSAALEGLDTVYILNPGRCQGHTALDLWYAKALYRHLSTK